MHASLLGTSTENVVKGIHAKTGFEGRVCGTLLRDLIAIYHRNQNE